jgi:soluble lytic murein transglycosylase-like protein
MATLRRPERRILLILWTLVFASACATHSPGDRASTPSATKARSADAPAAKSGASVDRLDRTSPSGSFDFALSVLEHKAGRKLSAAQRKSVARALVLGEEEHGLSVVLSLAIIELESGFDPNARGPAGSIGLMQLQPATAREIAQRNGLAWQSQNTLLDPEQNARLGLAYLAQLRKRFGTTERAVAAYNMGPGNLQRLLARRSLSRGPYLTKVYAHVDALHAEFGASIAD